MSGEHTPSLSDEEDEDELDLSTQPSVPAIQGYLSKWTNYLHGWQERWVLLREGTLSYYKSEFDTAFGCRGSISMAKATIEPHEFDECRFDVSVNDCMYYLRTTSIDERQKWVDALEAVKAAESGYGSETSLRKGGSMLSLSSVTSMGTTPSTSSFKRGRGLREKLLELETFRDIVGRQIDTLQSYFDACSENSSRSSRSGSDIRDRHHDDLYGSNEALDHDADDEMEELSKTPTPASMAERLGRTNLDDSNLASLAKGIDFRGESITFKATTAGILATLEHCLDIMNKREDYWQRRLERETEKRKKAESNAKDTALTARKHAFLGGPDFEEGPHCALNEEEFYDAMEMELERQNEQAECYHERTASTALEIPIPPPTLEEPAHRLSIEAKEKNKENLLLIQESVDENWYLVHEDGDMKVFRRDYEEGGIILDPMKATHIVKGITAREMAHYFFDKESRLDWDATIDYFKVIETCSNNTIIFHQVLKRIWPSSQRDLVFVSHITDVPPSEEGERLDNEVGYAWMVNNWSVEHPEAPSNKFVRVTMAVAFFCQTIIEPRQEGEELTRDHISCKITYSANVNPGGWAPPSVVRALSKREYPKFLRKISSLCQEAYQDKDLML